MLVTSSHFTAGEKRSIVTTGVLLWVAKRRKLHVLFNLCYRLHSVFVLTANSSDVQDFGAPILLDFETEEVLPT